MRDPNRLYGFYSELQRIHITHFPDWRFGQFMYNFMYWLTNSKGVDPFFPEESQMLDYLHEYTNELLVRGSSNV